MKSTVYRLKDLIIDILLVMEPQFHLGRMHVDVHIFTVNLHVKHHKRILMLHGEILISVFDRFRYDRIFHITPVDKIILKIPVPPGNHRFPQKPGNLKPRCILLYPKKVRSDVPSVDVIDYIFQISVT